MDLYIGVERCLRVRLPPTLVISPGVLTNASGLIRLAHTKIPSPQIQRRNGFGPSSSSSFFKSIRGRVCYNKHVVSLSSDHQSYKPPEEPLWLSLLRDIVWSTRSLFSFMAEQPSQLKYIEWASFTTTLKTATLSLFLVAVFIVALSSVDSALCFILALILKKSP